MALNDMKRDKDYDDKWWPFTDDFIFMMVMQSAEICRDFLQMVLPEEGFEEVRVRPQGNLFFTDDNANGAENFTIETQKTLKFAKDRHGVRLDALAKAENKWAAIEMQTWKEPALGKRSRYYKCNMDLDQLETGSEYRDLKRSYVIFICTYDPFGQGSPVYYFQSWDVKNRLNIGDEAYTIVLNTSCSHDKVPENLMAFYEYVNDPSRSEGSELVRNINERVQKYNSQEWRVKRMRFEELRREQYEKGLSDATERLNKLTVLLAGQGRVDDLIKAASDGEFQKKLLQEFGLSKKESNEEVNE